LPATASWPFLLLSALLHIGYFVSLMLAYREGDLSQVYPIARGTGPLGVAALSGIVAGETLSAREFLGVAVISLGVFSLALGPTRLTRAEARPVILAFATGLFITAYTLVDGLGVRVSGNPLAYTAWLFLLHGLPFAIVLAVRRPRETMLFLRADWAMAVFGGVLTLAAYGLVLWALALGAIAPIAALRETGVIIAAAIGAATLGEPFGARRVLAAAVVVAGIILLSLP